MLNKSKAFYKQSSLQVQPCLTKRAPDAGDSAQIPSRFLRLSIFLAGRLRRPRPSAGNANRWLAAPRANAKPSLIRKFRFCDWLKSSNPFFSGGVFQVWFESDFQQASFPFLGFLFYRLSFHQQSFGLVLSSR